jgi:putative ABC transport system ATP-binding protein
MLIELENTTKIYNQGKPNEVTALYDVSLQIEDQTMVCLQGASGSGKSTLLAIIGFIFQQFNILPRLSVLDNITLPLLPLGISPGARKARARELMDQLSISHRENFPAGQISGGEMQRVAIARALINNQPIILADEPTAHLDSRLSIDFMQIMADLKTAGKTIIIASHDTLVSEHPAIDKILNIKDGRIHVP